MLLSLFSGFWDLPYENMQIIYLLFLASLAQGILGKSVTFTEDDYDIDMFRERRSPSFDDDDLSDDGDDYGNFFDTNQVEQPAPLDDTGAGYEFPVKSDDASQKANDAAKALKDIAAAIAKIKKEISDKLTKLEAEAKKAKDAAEKAVAAAKAAAAKAKAAAAAAAAKAKAAAAKKPAAKATAKPSTSAKTQEINVVIRFPQETFKPQLQKSTSKEYLSLGKKLQDQCVAIYKTALKGFKITKFSPGSVVVDMALKFLATEKDPLKKLKDFLKKGKFAGLPVCASLVKAYNKKGVLCAGACPTCQVAAATPVSTCPSACSPPVASYPAPAPVPAPVYAPAPAPIYSAPAPAPSMCPSACPATCCAAQPSCPSSCAPGCCVNVQGR